MATVGGFSSDGGGGGFSGGGGGGRPSGSFSTDFNLNPIHDFGVASGDVGHALRLGLHPLTTILPDLASQFIHSPSGAIRLAEDPKLALAMPYQMVNDLTSYKTWYNHPAYNIEDVMAVLSGGAAAGARIGAVGRVLADTSELGPTEAAVQAGIDEPWSTGQKLRYAAIHGEKTPQRIIWQRPLDEDPESPTFGQRVPVINPKTGTVDPRVWGSAGSSFSRNPLSQWFQKQLDTFHENNPDLGSNFPLSPFKKQAFRAGKAQFAASFGEKALSRVDAEALIRKYAKLSPAEHEAVHIPGRLMTAKGQLAYLEEKGKGLSGFQKRHNDQWIQNTKDAMQFLDDDATITTPASDVSIPDDSGTMIRTETPEESNSFNLRTAGPFVAKHIATNPELKTAVKSATRIELNPRSYDRMLTHAQNVVDDPKTTTRMRASAQAVVDKLTASERPAKAATKLEPPPPTLVHSEGGTYNVAKIKDEYPHLQEYFNDAKAVLRRARRVAAQRRLSRGDAGDRTSARPAQRDARTRVDPRPEGDTAGAAVGAGRRHT